MEIIAKVLGGILAIFIVAFVIGIILSYPLMIFWNLTIPDLFDLPEITFWQAFGLNIVSSILFKSSTSSNNND